MNEEKDKEIKEKPDITVENPLKLFTGEEKVVDPQDIIDNDPDSSRKDAFKEANKEIGKMYPKPNKKGKLKEDISIDPKEQKREPKMIQRQPEQERANKGKERGE